MLQKCQWGYNIDGKVPLDSTWRVLWSFVLFAEINQWEFSSVSEGHVKMLWQPHGSHYACCWWGNLPLIRHVAKCSHMLRPPTLSCNTEALLPCGCWNFWSHCENTGWVGEDFLQEWHMEMEVWVEAGHILCPWKRKTEKNLRKGLLTEAGSCCSMAEGQNIWLSDVIQ